MSEAKKKPAKRAYVAPTLVTYGDVSTLTQNRRRGRLKDGGTKQKSRTR